MNVTLSLSSNGWAGWRPQWTYHRWAIHKDPGQVWYHQLQWGFLFVQVDNEQ